MANALAPVFAQLGTQARMLELGGGTGAFAEAVLLRLAELDALPSRYAILEPSADLRERQQQRLQQNLPAELAARVDWVDRPFEEDWEGVVFANEVIDALPTPRFLIRDGEVYEETVELDAEGNFIRGAQPADIQRLQTDDVGFVFADDGDDAIHVEAAVCADAAVDIVGE